MRIEDNKKVIDPDQYPTYVVSTLHHGSSVHKSVADYLMTDNGALCIYGMYCIGIGSQGDTNGSQVKVEEKVYAAGQWLSIEYVSGNCGV